MLTGETLNFSEHRARGMARACARERKREKKEKESYEMGDSPEGSENDEIQRVSRKIKLHNYRLQDSRLRHPRPWLRVLSFGATTADYPLGMARWTRGLSKLTSRIDSRRRSGRMKLEKELSAAPRDTIPLHYAVQWIQAECTEHLEYHPTRIKITPDAEWSRKMAVQWRFLSRKI